MTQRQRYLLNRLLEVIGQEVDINGDGLSSDMKVTIEE